MVFKPLLIRSKTGVASTPNTRVAAVVSKAASERGQLLKIGSSVVFSRIYIVMITRR